MAKFQLSCLLSLGLFVGATTAWGDDSGRKGLADKHGPAGIMGDHLHEQGEWMVEYRYMNMYMDDNRVGETTLSDSQAIAYGATSNPITNRGATPTQMTMEMHMVHVMYGASDDVTLYTMLMLPSLTMDHLRGPANPAGPGTDFTTHNSGFGDTTLGALIRLYSTERCDWILNLGASVPTGDIYRTSSAPTGGLVSQPLPYPMRLGSGTFNARPGMTVKYFADWWSWGGQIQTDLPIGKNYRDYQVGSEVRLNTWTQYLLTDQVALSWRGEHVWRDNYDGADPDTPDALISTNVESFRGGYWYNMGFGAQAMWRGNYFNAEIVPTLGQDLNGIQLETDYSIIASWSRAF
ncbi:transporter [Roseiconus nitratireducens]|uniref:Transporter n=1 Tax=Roseiconus nitratireducens TaxID=2605748 RepID=A0A5M6D082_9BACT|nr:transporter [Roseiconus nitratireducens]KAA5540080.1 transporter [Roseiconus nitratireducens]